MLQRVARSSECLVAAIEPRIDQSTSPEGQVAGRSGWLSQVEIRDACVARQHLRLRLVNGAT